MVVAIVCPAVEVVSETFIHDHAQRLPAETIVIYGGTHEAVTPRYYGRQQPLWPAAGWARRQLRRAQQRLLRLPPGYFERQALTAFLRQRRVAVVLAEFGPSGVAMLEACQAARVPLVVHFHGYDAYRSTVLQGVGRHYERLFQQAAAVVAVSRAMEQQLLALGAPRERLHYNPYGVDLAQFQGARPQAAPPLFVAAGRLVDKKAPYLTLLAFKEVVAACPEARLTMIGDGPLREACARLVAAWGLTGSVTLAGAQPRTAVAQLLRQARAFVQHSVRADDGDAEGTPVAVLEASATGLPVVATRHAGIPDVVSEGQTGYLVDEGDVAGMARHMLTLARDPGHAAALGAAGRARIQAEFSMERSLDNLWRILQASAA